MNLVWRGPVTDPSGYAAGGRAFLRGLVEEGARVRLEPNLWNSREGVDADGKRALIDLTRTELTDVDASVQHTIGRLFDPYVAGRVRVGRTTSETDRIPADWVARCDALDEVWVPTATAREALVSAGVGADRVVVVPEPLELDRLDRTAAPLDIPGAHGTVFLSAFDWSLRQGLGRPAGGLVRRLRRRRRRDAGAEGMGDGTRHRHRGDPGGAAGRARPAGARPRRHGRPGDRRGSAEPA